MILRTLRALVVSGLHALTILLLVLLVSLALYVSVGRQLTPRVADYSEWLEQRLAQELGVSVHIGQLSGEWLQFTPRFILEDVRLGDADALQLRRVAIAPALLESLQQRRLVIADTSLAALDINFQQTTEGRWQLAGFNANGQVSDPERVFELITRLSRLTLTDTRLSFEDLQGNATRLDAAHLNLQTSGAEHFLTLRARLPDSPDTLRVDAELRGNTLAELQGQMYASLPAADYSVFIPALRPADQAAVEVTEARLAGELWLELYPGVARSAVFRGQGELSVLTAPGVETEPEVLSLSNIQLPGLYLTQDIGRGLWMAYLDDLAFESGGQSWPVGDMTLSYQTGSAAELKAETLDLGILSRVLSALPLDHRLHRELLGFNPRGELRHLRVNAGFLPELQGGEGSALHHVSVVANVDQGALSAYRGAPAFWGVDAYAEFHFDVASSYGEGFAEVNSNSLSMHLPSLFNDIWNYDQVDGRVGFRVDADGDVNFRMASGVIVAQSEAVTARGQFAAEVQLGENRYIDLELKVGALQADASHKSLYLPTAPSAPRGIQGLMQWVDEAVLAGDAAGSGLIFRGRVHQGADPLERTLQMFYRVADGSLRFDPAWPVLEDLKGFVLLDNTDVDIAAQSGSTLGIHFDPSVASVRGNPGGGRWLTVRGQGRGSAAQGLQYLQQTPVTEGIAQYFSNWVAEGDTDVELALSIPFNISNARPSVSLALDFKDNRLFIPEYDIQLEQLSGALSYDDEKGLSSQNLSATVFGKTVHATVQADGLLPAPAATERSSVLRWSSSAEPQALAEWSTFPSAVKPLLSQLEGEIAYQAELILPMAAAEGAARSFPRLQLRSELNDVSVMLPAPFSKPLGQSRQLALDLEFRPGGPVIDLRWQDVMQMNMVLADGLPQSGLIFLGPTVEGLRVRRLNPSAPGIEVTGALQTLNYAEWQRSLAAMFASRAGLASGSPGWLSQLQGTAELSVNELVVASERFEQLNLSLRRQPDAWELGVLGEDVSGHIVYPLDVALPWQVNLDYLHLGEAPPEAAEELALLEAPADELDLEDLPVVEYELPREDPLASLDPRNFPPMQLSVGQVTLSGADFGAWRFSLSSDQSGAVFRDLVITARGLSIGHEAKPAEFRWIYDGHIHRSVLNAEITASDLGPVLSAYGYAPSLQSSAASFEARLHWDGSPAYFSALGLSGDVDINIRNGRFQQRAGVANSALRLISVLNFDAVVRRLRFSDDFLRSGLSYDQISGRMNLRNGIVNIIDRLQIIGPASLFQVSGELNLAEQTMDADLFITLPVSENIPWLGGLAALNNLINWQLAIGVFLFDRIFGGQVDNLTSAQYTLEGPWDSVEPRLYQVFASGSQE